MPDSFLQELQSGDAARIREVLAVVKEKAPDPEGPQHKALISQLVGISRSSELSPQNRAVAADISGELGWLPDDLYQFLPLFENQTPVLYAGKYPVTNVQYERFLTSPDFGDKELWCDFPKFDKNSQPMKETWEEQGWQWLQEKLKKKKSSPDQKIVHPEYWHNSIEGLTL